MDSINIVDNLPRNLDRPSGSCLRRQSTGDIQHPDSATRDSPQIRRARSLSAHRDPHYRMDQAIVRENVGGSQPLYVFASDSSEEQQETTLAEEEVASSSHDDIEDRRPQLAKDEANWRPWWLQPLILGGFAGLFLSAAIALAGMVWYSETHHGLCSTRRGLEYNWRFGPTAVLTIVAGLWARVSLQAARYTPWMELRRKGVNNGLELSLDYTSMLFPIVIFQSLRRKHYLVFLVFIVSILVSLQTVLAPGLYRLAEVPVWHDNNIRVLDAFNLSTFERSSQLTKPIYIPGHIVLSTGADLDSSAYYIPRAIHDFKMLTPFGVAENAAYQIFEPRGSVGAPVKLIVDGFVMNFHCLKLESYTVTKAQLLENPDSNMTSRVGFDLSINFENCKNISHSIDQYYNENSDVESFTDWNVEYLPGGSRRCPNLPGQANQLIYYSSTLALGVKNSSYPRLVGFAAIVCSETSWISPVEIIDNGSRPILNILPNQSQIPYNVSIWSAIMKSVPFLNVRFQAPLSGQAKYGPLGIWLQFQDKKEPSEDFLLNTTDVLYDAMMGVTSRLGPYIAHYHFRQTNISVIPGQLRRNTERLAVVLPIGVSMLVIFTAMALISCFVMLRYKNDSLVWQRDPATALGGIMFLRHHGPDLHHEAPQPKRNVAQIDWGCSQFVPIVLRSWAQVVFMLVVLGVIIALICTLEKSRIEDGIAAIEGRWYLLWTSLPTTIMLGVASYVTSYDTSTRALHTLYSLSTGPCTAKVSDTAPLDMSQIRAMFHVIRRRTGSMILLQISVNMSILLTTIASTLLQVEPVPKGTRFELTQLSTFSNRTIDWKNIEDYRDNRAKLGSMLLRRGEGNITYPPNTYLDLAFPGISKIEPSIVQTAKDATVEISLPAASLLSICQEAEVDIVYTTDQNRNVITQPLKNDNRGVTIAIPEDQEHDVSSIVNMEFACEDGSRRHTTRKFPAWKRLFDLKWSIDADTESVCQPEGPSGPTDSEPAYSKTLLLTWSKWDYTAKRFASFRAWTCHDSWTQVMVAVKLIMVDGELAIDHNNPPRPDNLTMRPWYRSLPLPYLDNTEDGSSGIHDLGTAYPLTSSSMRPEEAGNMSRPFSLVMKPYGDIHLEDFGNQEMDDRILEALNRNRAILSAQLLNVENRLSLEEIAIPGSRFPLEAVVVDYEAKQLTQNTVPTYTLVAILSFIFAAHLMIVCSKVLRRFFGWRKGLLDLDVKGLAPDGFNSIAMTTALLQSSNAIQHMPSQLNLSKGETYEQLRGLRFRLGWFRRESDQTRHFTVGVLADENFTFLGTKKELDTKEFQKKVESD